jgi:lysozyme family protein
MSHLTQSFFEKILAAEGGYQNQSADSGNFNRCGVNAGTKYGITPNAWQEYSGQQCPGAETMKNLTQTQAWGFMDWWGNRWRIWKIYDQDFAELVFNAFYGNPSAAAKTLQLTLSQRGYALAPDGIMGSKTLAAVNVETAKDKTGLYNAYRAAWLSYLQSLGNATYTAGWTNRMDTFFPPLPASGTPDMPPAEPNYQVELWQRRFSGMFKSADDAIWVWTALALLFGLIAILYYHLKTIDL